ncbi:MAG: Mur ligase family protein, partial [Calditrichia bacterium]
SSVSLGGGDYFIIEGDEYDSAFFDKRPKFLHYFPYYLIINNIEFDHADIYQSLSEIKAGFKKLIRIVPGNGLIVANGDNAAVRDVLKEKYSRLQYFGSSGKNHWSFAILNMDDCGTEFLLKNNGKAIGEFRFSQHGEHQIQNAVAAIAVARDAGIGWKAIRQALAGFEGVKRRLEHWGIFQGAIIYDDFAHHPTAILQNLKTLKKMHPDKRIFALFEPRTNTTTRNIFQNELTDALSVAHGVFITPVHRPERFPPGERLSIPALVEALQKRGKLVIRVKEYSQLIPALSEILTDNDVMVIMTNGNLGGQYEQIRELAKNENTYG